MRNPLYKWSLDPTRAGNNTASTTTAQQKEQGAAGTNREAEHALLRIQDKLAGRVAGTSEVLAVEGQVRALLDEARNEENLCRMYDGWAAWL